jgi:hypothetical protein
MSFSEALRIGMENIACGGDTGVFAHGQNALELVLMRQLGAPWDCVLSWATDGGWKCVRGMEREGERRIRNVRNLQMSELLQDTILERGVPFGVTLQENLPTPSLTQWRGPGITVRRDLHHRRRMASHCKLFYLDYEDCDNATKASIFNLRLQAFHPMYFYFLLTSFR